jgi:hypothetical protein
VHVSNSYEQRKESQSYFSPIDFGFKFPARNWKGEQFRLGSFRMLKQCQFSIYKSHFRSKGVPQTLRGISRAGARKSIVPYLNCSRDSTRNGAGNGSSSNIADIPAETDGDCPHRLD